MRGRKQKLKIDEDTLQNLLDECYNDTNDLKAEILTLYQKWDVKVVEIGEFAAIGRDLIKLLDQKDKLLDKKLKIAQQIHQTITERNRLEKMNKTEDEEKELSIPDNLQNQINQMVELAKNKNK